MEEMKLAPMVDILVDKYFNFWTQWLRRDGKGTETVSPGPPFSLCGACDGHTVWSCTRREGRGGTHYVW